LIAPERAAKRRYASANSVRRASVRTFVNADELVARDVLALAAQSGLRAKVWTTTIESDGKVVLTLANALRRHLGLAPITSTTTTPTL
jgi:hypothetical protein